MYLYLHLALMLDPDARFSCCDFWCVQYEAELAECDATVTALKNDFAKKVGPSDVVAIVASGTQGY
jgi:hypothetical protein